MKIYAILTEILACFLPGWAKDLAALLYYRSFIYSTTDALVSCLKKKQY